jgi:ABC-2 type transport system ATP-binding protein
VHEPKVIIMDEPTVGIDPQSRRHILDSVKALNREGQAVLYTTHYMEEAEELSDRVAILDHGKLIAQGTRAELVARIGERTRLRFVVPHGLEAAVAAWEQLDGVDSVTHAGEEVSLLAAEPHAVVPRAFEAIARLDVRVVNVSIEEPDLEAVFLHLTGRALRD